MNPFKRLIRNVRDIFDANSEEDIRKRQAQGQPRYYQQQQQQVAQQRQAAPQAVRPSMPAPRPTAFIPSFANAAGGLGKQIAKPFVETADYVVKAPVLGARGAIAKATGNDVAFNNAKVEQQKNFDESLAGQMVKSVADPLGAVAKTVKENPRYLQPGMGPINIARDTFSGKIDNTPLGQRFNAGNTRKAFNSGNLSETARQGGQGVGTLGTDWLNLYTLGKNPLQAVQKAPGVANTVKNVTGSAVKYSAVASPLQTLQENTYKDAGDFLNQTASNTGRNFVMGAALDSVGRVVGAGLRKASSQQPQAPVPRPTTRLRPNEAATLSDFQEVLTGRVGRPETQAAIIKDARQAAARNNLDIISGSNRDIMDRINTTLEQPQNAKRLWRPKPLNEGGYVQVPGRIKTLDSVNPTGTVFTKYDAKSRANAKLADNITSLDRTSGGSPDEIITIYRGAPANQTKLNSGDFVTTNRQLAKDYAGNGRVIEQKVRKADVLDDINEPLGEEYIFRPQKKKLFKPLNEVGAIGRDVRPEIDPLESLKQEARKRGYGDKYSEEGAIANTVDELMEELNEVRKVGVPLLDKYGDFSKSGKTFEQLLTPAERKAYKEAVAKSDKADKLLKSYFDNKKTTQSQPPKSTAKTAEARPDTSLQDMQRGLSAQDALASSPSRMTSPTLQRTIPQQPNTLVSTPQGITRTSSSLPQTTPQNIRIKAPYSQRNIPVKEMTQVGDVITAKNINPNIKTAEKRFSVDDKGDLLPDKKGAYSIFTDNDGRVTGFRIGDEFTSAKSLGDLSDVNDYGSTLATMRRNVERGFGKKTADRVNNFLVDHQQKQATKLITRQAELNKGLKQVADDLGISFGVGRHKAKKVSAAIQEFGEGKKTQAQIVDEFGIDQAAKIIEADKWFRNQYDTLLDEANATLTKFGYDPIPKRQNYYTHFQEPGLWEKFGLKMQEIKDYANPTMQDAAPNATRGNISNKLAGESEFTAPNKAFNKYALRRKGDVATPDAFRAFEKYLTPTLNNIYMTPSITRARVLTKAIAQDADIVGKDANKIIIQTKEWANRLAGKTNRFDRPIVDTKMGNRAIRATQWAQSRVGANSIVGNLSTAVMQPIVLAQTSGKFGYKNTVLAAMQELGTAHSKSAPIRQSEFMARRYANIDQVTAGKTKRAAEIANTPLRVVEETAARITWNAAHNDALSKGIKGKDAIKYADIQAEKTLAGRSIGEKPELFESKSAGLVTMYQLEVNNFWQQFGKEMTKTQAAKTMVAAYGLNLILQQVTGRQVGFNPIDAVLDSVGTATSDEELDIKAATIAQRLTGEVVDSAPFVGTIGATMIGEDNWKKLMGRESNSGRFGISSPIRTLYDNPEMLVSPFGSSQAKKIFKGGKSLVEQGIFDKNGKQKAEVERTPANIFRGLAFGPSAIPKVGEYYKSIGQKKTATSDASSNKNLPNADQKVKVDGKDKAIADLTQKELRQAARTNPAAEQAYNQLDLERRRKSANEKIYPVDLDEGSINTLRNHDARTTKEREEYVNKTPQAEYWLETAKYKKDLAEGTISDGAEKLRREYTLAKKQVGSQFNKKARDLHSMNKTQLYKYLSTNPDGAKLAEELIAYDDALTQSGLQAKNKLRDKYGRVAIAPKQSGGSGRKGGRKGRRGGKAKIFKAGNVSFLPKMATSNTRKLLSSARVEYRGPSGKKPKVQKA